MPAFDYDGFSFTLPDDWREVPKVPSNVVEEPRRVFIERDGTSASATVLLYHKLGAILATDNFNAIVSKTFHGEKWNPTYSQGASGPNPFISAAAPKKGAFWRIWMVNNDLDAAILILECPVNGRAEEFHELMELPEVVECEQAMINFKFT